jgi:hypothetical protein
VYLLNMAVVAARRMEKLKSQMFGECDAAIAARENRVRVRARESDVSRA